MQQTLDQMLQESIAQVNAAIEAHRPHYPDVAGPTYLALQAQIDTFLTHLEQLADQDPFLPDSALRDYILTLQDHPVFIGGMAKSGTSLMRNLLDHHPQLAIFPCEGVLFHSLNIVADLPYKERCRHILLAALEQLISHDLGGGPYWVLTRGDHTPDPYANLVSAYRQRLAQLPPSDEAIVQAIVYAYLLARSPFAEPRAERAWVEKTPDNIDRMSFLLKLYPAAKFIICLRDPRAVIASTKFRHLQKYHNFKLQSTLNTMRLGWQKLLCDQLQHGDRILLVHYEDLVSNTRSEMERVADFLATDFDDRLLVPTVGGLSARANSGYTREVTGTEVHTGSIERWRQKLTAAEIDFINAEMAPLMAQFGYEESAIHSWTYFQAVFNLHREYHAASLPFSRSQAIRGRLKRFW